MSGDLKYKDITEKIFGASFEVHKILHHNHYLNHGLGGLMDFTDLKSEPSKNLCHLSNPRKSVIQTNISENYKELAI